MVGPGRKREAVEQVRQSLGTSERRACASLGQARSTQRYRGRRRQSDGGLIKAMRRIALREPRAGYRSVARHLRREGWIVNVKRVHRLWKQEGLKVPAKARKRRRLGESANGAQRMRAERKNHVWSYDFVWDQTESGGRLKWLPILDEHTRECLALEVESSITAADVVHILEGIVDERGAPEFIRSDNGPEFIAEAVKTWIAERGMKTLYIEPGSPWENPYSESFNSRFRDEFLNVEAFGSKLEAKVLGKQHREKYNNRRPHSSLGDISPPRSSPQAVLLRSGLRPALRKTASPTKNNNPISHSKWLNLRGHSTIPHGDSYLQTYPYMLNGIQSLMPLNQNTLLIAGSSIFCWMPTQSKINTGLLPASLAIIATLPTQPLTRASLQKLADTFQTIRGSSVVAASKLLHFLYPDKYPIWDSRVRVNYGYLPRNTHQNAIYINYLNTVQSLVSDTGVVTACANLNTRINAAGYPGTLTTTRLVELCLFL